MFAGLVASCHDESKPGSIISFKGTYELALFSRHCVQRPLICLTTFSCSLRGFGGSTTTPLLQTNLFLDLTHVYLNFESTVVSPSFLQADPALTAAIALGAKNESTKEVRTIKIKWVRFILRPIQISTPMYLVSKNS